MESITKQELEKVLIEGLGLDHPTFDLEPMPGGKISGSIISDFFNGMKDSERQEKIWAVLDAEFGTSSTQKVGTLLPYTDAEWNVDLAES